MMKEYKKCDHCLSIAEFKCKELWGWINDIPEYIYDYCCEKHSIDEKYIERKKLSINKKTVQCFKCKHFKKASLNDAWMDGWCLLKDIDFAYGEFSSSNYFECEKYEE